MSQTQNPMNFPLYYIYIYIYRYTLSIAIYYQSFLLGHGLKEMRCQQEFSKQIWQLCHVAIQFPQPSLTSKSI